MSKHFALDNLMKLGEGGGGGSSRSRSSIIADYYTSCSSSLLDKVVSSYASMEHRIFKAGEKDISYGSEAAY